MDPLQAYILDKALLVAIVFVSYYLAAYIREKGKNLATKEDLDEITRKAKEIEASISSDLWVKQRRRELQLEILNKLNDLLAEFLVMEQRRPSPLSEQDRVLQELGYGGGDEKLHPKSRGNIERWKKYEERVEGFSIRWFALHGLARALFSDNAYAAVKDVDGFIAPEMDNRPIHEFIESRDRAIKALLEEAIAQK